MRRTDGRLVPQPAAKSVVAPGDMLVAIGPPEAIEQLEGWFQPLPAGGRRAVTVAGSALD